MNGPFALKLKIDNCLRLAKECGFELRENGNHYVAGEIYVYAAPDNTVFAKDVCLERLPSWEIAEAFFAGYLKCELAYKAGGKT
jgi:hypothetical protein